MDLQTLEQCVRKNLALDANNQVVAQEKEIQYKDELLSWRRKIEATEILLNALKQKAVVAEHNRNMWSSILAPIRCLPADVLIEIFTLACLGDVFHLFPDSDANTPVSTSHSLIHVCKYWRDIALDIPRIWNHFVVVHPAVFDKRRFRWEDLSGVYGKNLTHIDLYLLEGMLFNRDPSLDRSIFKYAHQYTSLRLEAPATPLWTPSTGILQREYDMPLLEELVFRCRKDEAHVVTYLHKDLNFKAPRLKRLSVYYYPTLESSEIRFPWNQLTHLFLGSMDCDLDGEHAYDHFFPFLKKLDNITYLGLSGVNMGRTYSRATILKSMVVLSKLRHLEIQDFDLSLLQEVLYGKPGIRGRDFLGYISAPALTTFDLFLSNNRSEILERAFQHVASFLGRAPLLARIRVVGSTPPTNWACLGDPDYPILAFSGSSQQFEDIAEASDATFTRHAAVREQPLKRWPLGVYTEDHFIDRFLERGDPLFQRAEAERGVDASGHRDTGSELERKAKLEKRYEGEDTRNMMRKVFKLLGQKHGVADGERKAYFAL
ncbi:hypothetical protein DFP72DRAFT_1163685 [Ephemerocybe angulata]|uniref:F-box domain-containing protein n=1 Tax=Ephemerocybe angulata TaxID=980116 RepID=A0A8H6MGI5_9AGAR|nr:hypothetical protein DFP72DRAFT_1163685 [Tulosesus angulatus]